MDLKVVAEYGELLLAIPADRDLDLGDRTLPGFVVQPDGSAMKTTVWAALKFGLFAKTPERTITLTP